MVDLKIKKKKRPNKKHRMCWILKNHSKTGLMDKNELLKLAYFMKPGKAHALPKSNYQFFGSWGCLVRQGFMNIVPQGRKFLYSLTPKGNLYADEFDIELKREYDVVAAFLVLEYY